MKTTEERFVWFVRERERIRRRRAEGFAPPYTEDPRLQRYWFPNICRLDDPSTGEFHRMTLAHLRDPEKICMAAVIFRLFGSIKTARAIRQLFFEDYSEKRLLALAGPLKRRFSRGQPGSRVRTLDDVARACAVLRGTLWARLRRASLEEAVEVLQVAPGIGPELAYEIAYDLRHTPVLDGAPDVRTWALPGRAATAVAGAFLGREMSHSRQADRDDTLGLMRALYSDSRLAFPAWEMSEIQRGLSLFHTWAREPKPTRRFR